MPPGDGNHGTITVNGRKYTCALGSTIDVIDQDAAVMMANGWTTASVGGVGSTSNRPTNPVQGQEFHDTTLGYTIKYEGRNWRNPSTGAIV
jgi:hypothetical protein